MAEASKGLKNLSGERIHTELQKSFDAIGWQKSALLMKEAGIDKALFGADFTLFDNKFIPQMKAHRWLVILASLLPVETVIGHAQRVRLSNAETQMLHQISKGFSDEEWTQIASDRWYEFAYDEALYLAERALVFMAHKKPSRLLDHDRLRQIALFEPPPCPVTGHDLIKAGVQAGKSMGLYIQRARGYFAASHFTADKDDILRYLLDS